MMRLWPPCGAGASAIVVGVGPAGKGMRHIFGEHPAMSAKVICPCEVRTMEAEADAAKRGTS